MRRHKINKANLRGRKVSQNDKGVYYYSPTLGYWGTTIDKFDKAIPPKAYKKYTDGTHGSTNVDGVNIKRQMAYDYPAVKDSVVTCSEDVRMVKVTTADGSYCVIESGKKILGISRWQDVLVHTYKWAKVGTTVKAGKPICYIKTDHLHIFCKKWGLPYPIRKVILA